MIPPVCYYSCKACFTDSAETLEDSALDVEITIIPLSDEEKNSIQTKYCMICFAQGKLVKAEGRVIWNPNGTQRYHKTPLSV